MKKPFLFLLILISLCSFRSYAITGRLDNSQQVDSNAINSALQEAITFDKQDDSIISGFMSAEDIEAFTLHEASLEANKAEVRDRLDRLNRNEDNDNKVAEPILEDAISKPQCVEKLTEVPPFMISKVDKGNAGTENYVVSANGTSITKVQGDSSVLAQENFHFENQSNARRIARGTIVTLRGSEEDIAANLAKIKAGGNGFRVPVTVRSANETYQQFTDQDDEAKFVEKDDEGMLWSKSMSAPQKDDRFIVMEDTFLLPDLKDKNLKGKGLEPLFDEATGKYRTNKCCQMEDVIEYAKNSDGTPVLDGNDQPVKVTQSDERGNTLPPKQVEKCTTSYMYKVIGATGDQSLNGQIITINHQCFESAIRPVKDNEFDNYENMINFMNNNYESKLSLDQLEFNDWGKARLPLKNEEDTRDPVAGVGSNDKFIYYKNGDAAKSDNWGTPTAICSLHNLTDKFFKKCKETEGRSDAQCMARVGDLSFVTPVKRSRFYSHKKKKWYWSNKDPLAHATHHSGNCIDLRPFRKDDSFNPLEYTDTGIYDQKITQQFVDMAKEFGASPILFNDPKVKGAKSAAGHDNHLHICFPPENKTVKESCAQRKTKPKRQVASGEISPDTEK